MYVGYTYDVTKSGDFFTKRLRPTSLRYPSATMINFTYGTAGSVDDLLNRFKTVQNGSTNIVDYTDMGIATPAIVKYPVPNLTSDYTGTGALDRFGRITDHAWKNASGTAVVQVKHGYDRVGNRLYREDVAATSAGKSFDELYAYDGMNQLIDMQRGKLNATKNGLTTKNGQENFAFDATGNWSTYKQDATGAGFTLTQPRTHNKANEIVTIAGASTYTASDANGNMTKCVKPNNWSAAFTLVYDAWNRLVIVKDSETTVATYGYNGLNHRVKKVVGSETRLFYFNRGWQCLEEYVGSTCDARYVWGLRYVDDLVTYRKGSTDYYSVADPNWNVVALTNTSGVVQERYTYAVFGKVNCFDAAFTTRATSSCSITRTFTGQVLDNETGLMLYRNRVYHPTLGRFVQRDPIGYSAGDVSLYRYVNNMPCIYMDIFGQDISCNDEDEEEFDGHYCGCSASYADIINLTIETIQPCDCKGLLHNALNDLAENDLLIQAMKCNVNIQCSDNCTSSRQPIDAITSQSSDGYIHICIKNGSDMFPQDSDPQKNFNGLLIHELIHVKQYLRNKGACKNTPYGKLPPPTNLRGEGEILTERQRIARCNECEKAEKPAYRAQAEYLFPCNDADTKKKRNDFINNGLKVSCGHVCKYKGCGRDFR